jgi:hypothetical protein
MMTPVDAAECSAIAVFTVLELARIVRRQRGRITLREVLERLERLEARTVSGEQPRTRVRRASRP